MPTVFGEEFDNAGQKVGLEIWRVEKMKVVRQPESDPCYKGSFYDGDSYICLHTKKKPGALERHIYFWLGKESSQDEKGVAAYKTVELDESLGGEPVQHREVQEHETPEFISLFKGGISYREGGIASGFKKVDRDAFTTRLLHVKGKRNISVSQVELSPSSLNKGDVFILDAGREIYQWNGPEASRLEKQKAMEATRKIRDEDRGGKAKVHIIDDGDDDSEFWTAFGEPKPASIADATDDAKAEAERKKNTKLYKLSDASGTLEKTEVEKRATKPGAAAAFHRDMLDTNDVFILDCGGSGIFAWVGKGASPQEKKSAMKFATEFISIMGYPDWIPVTRIVEKAETPLFKQNFVWPDKLILPGQGTTAGAKPKFVKKSFDASSMQVKKEREKVVMPDDGTGELEIWRIENLKRAPWPKELYGQFYGGDSYIVLYKYKDARGKDAAFIYFWQGLKSSQDEKAASAMLAMKLDDELGGYPVQCRVVQNKEPPHFYLIFKNKLVIHTGGIASGFKNSTEESYQDTDGTRLFHVKATNDYNIRAIQVEERAASLNSGDCFVLESPEMLYLWFGNGCSREERDFTKQIFRKIDNIQCPLMPTVVMEGKEPDGFWKALGGKGPYAQKAPDQVEDREPRLFHCSDARGYFWVEEIMDFDQEDLEEDDVMLLDTYREVFIWVGQGANQNEREEAMKLAKKYIADDASGRTEEDVSFFVIQQGCEPVNFTCHFHAWDDDKWRAGKTYEQMKAEMEAGGAEGSMIITDLNAALDSFKNTVYSYAQLTDPATKNKLDPFNRKEPEMHLSDAEFEQYMGMNKEAFEKLAGWKKVQQRKKAKL